LLRLAPCFEQVEPGELFLCFGEGTIFTEIFEPFPDAESAACAYPSQEVRDIVLGTGMEKGAAASYDLE